MDEMKNPAQTLPNISFTVLFVQIHDELSLESPQEGVLSLGAHFEPMTSSGDNC